MRGLSALNVMWFLNSKIVIFWRALAHIFLWSKIKVKRADKSKMGLPGEMGGPFFRVLCVIFCDYSVKIRGPAPRPGGGGGGGPPVSRFMHYILLFFVLNVWSTPSRPRVFFFVFCAFYSDFFVSDEGSQPPVLRCSV